MNIPLPILGSYFKVTETFYTGPGVAQTVQVARADPTRWSLHISNVSGGEQWLTTDPNSPGAKGIPFADSTFIELFFERHGALVQLPLYVTPATTQIATGTIIENFYQPPAGVA